MRIANPGSRPAPVSVLRAAACLLALLLLAPSGARADDPSDASGADASKADAPKAEAASTVAALTWRAARRWQFELPAETFHKVGGAIDLTGAGGARHIARVDGDGLRVDLDGDGSLDVRVGPDGGFVALEGPAGFRYAVRLRNAGSGWTWATSGVRRAKIGATRITLIDQDGDGRHDGVGRDAMVVGRGQVASFLSRVVNVAGTLYAVRVAADGGSLAYEPYEGAAGRIDLAGRWQAEARLRSAVLRSEDGSLSFDLAGHPDGLAVPAGRYVLHGGSLALGDSRVAFRRGKAVPIVVRAGETTRVAGGGPLRAAFAFQRRGEELVLDPGTLRWFGRAGEEYVGWAPFGKSPEFTVVDTDTKQEVAKAIFTGC